MEVSMTDGRIKELFKSAIIEVLEERGDLFREAFLGAIEDIALVRAIEDGESCEAITRDEAIGILER